MVLVVIGLFAFLFYRTPATPAGGDTGDTNFLSRFNPFASNRTTPSNTTNPTTDTSGFQPSTEDIQNSKLKKVSSMPVAGYGVFQKERLLDGETLPDPTNKKALPPKTEFVPNLRYVDRATGNLYQTYADKLEGEEKISGTKVPKVYEALFGNNGDSVAMRYLKNDGETIETFVGTLPRETLGHDIAGNNEVKGSFLPDNVQDMSVSPDGQKLFYLFNSADNIVGTTLNFVDGKKIQVFTSAFTEWLSTWPNMKLITLTTKPSGDIPGYMYTVSPDTKNLTRALGDINGLTTLTSPNGKLILYGDSNLSLSVFHTDTSSTISVGVKTMPEKCVWSSSNTIIYCAVPKSISQELYPDAWYKGEVSFADQIWKVDVISGITTMLNDPTLVGAGDMDGVKLMLDQNENYLFFVNKTDSFLWELGLK